MMEFYELMLFVPIVREYFYGASTINLNCHFPIPDIFSNFPKNDNQNS